ncbi:MAG: hypothetical protein JSV32_02495 [Dehalococcoidia bacterium]|nr:MAG: hypothetical protein JSV32_02495 [Dehalococcoidia bacterium]
MGGDILKSKNRKILYLKHYPYSLRIIAVLSILLMSFISVIGCSHAESSVDIIGFEEFKVNPPVELTLDQLHEEYINDPIAADDKYKGLRLCFYGVEAQAVVGYLQYFISDNVKFVLASNSQMQNVEPGNILNLVGECRGLEKAPREIVTIRDCWAEGVNCDLGGYEIADTY